MLTLSVDSPLGRRPADASVDGTATMVAKRSSSVMGLAGPPLVIEPPWSRSAVGVCISVSTRSQLGPASLRSASTFWRNSSDDCETAFGLGVNAGAIYSTANRSMSTKRTKC